MDSEDIVKTSNSSDCSKLIDDLRKEVCYWKLQYSLSQKCSTLSNSENLSSKVEEQCSSADVDYSGLPQLERISPTEDCDSSECESEYDGMPGLEPIENNYDDSCGSEHGSSSSSDASSVSSCNKSVSPTEVIVTGFPFGISEAEILGIFKAYEPITCRIMINGPTHVGKQLSYAYVYLPNEDLAKTAESDLNYTIYRNHIIEVKKSIC